MAIRTADISAILEQRELLSFLQREFADLKRVEIVRCPDKMGSTIIYETVDRGSFEWNDTIIADPEIERRILIFDGQMETVYPDESYLDEDF